MPDELTSAVFVTVGLMLMGQLLGLLRAVPRGFLRFLISAVMGLCALLLGNAAGSFFGVGLGLNAVTLPVSAGLGVPGVALLWALRYWV